jgi:DNA ligase OB-like domain
MAKREFLQLSHVLDATKHTIGSWFASEKLDGQRAFWDGGLTRGMLASDVPFANVEKDGRYLFPPKATGLWSRYGKAIQAPDWWLDGLPPGFPIDGELYMGRGRFQELTSCVKQLNGDDRWKEVKLLAFDSPALRVIFGNGEIKNTNYKKKFVNVYHNLPCEEMDRVYNRPKTLEFRTVYTWMKEILNLVDWDDSERSFTIHNQIQLAHKNVDAQVEVANLLDKITSEGGEGLILRNPTSYWVPERSHACLKVKGLLDSEARVVGYVWGRQTELGSKLLGLMGALIVEWNGKRFELSGFTDEERRMTAIGMSDRQTLNMIAFEQGINNPGEEVRDHLYNATFPRNSLVTFKYRELTTDGIPKEARFLRKAE